MRGLRSALIGLATCFALALFAPAAGIAAEEPATPAAPAVPVVHYTHESLKTAEQQLASGQITAATFNKRARTVHLTLTNGQHMLASYPPHDEPRIAAALAAKGVPVTIEKKAQAAKEAKKPVKHKLRYIVGGIAIVVIVVVGVVLLVDRRRKLSAE